MNTKVRFCSFYFLMIIIFLGKITFPQQKDFHKLPLPDAASVNPQYRLIIINEQKFLLFTLENYSLMRRESSDAGNSWSNAIKVIEGTGLDDRVNWFDVHHVGNNKMYLLFNQNNVSLTYFKVSSDLGFSWGDKIRFEGIYSQRNTSFFTTSNGETYFIFDERYFARFTSDTSWTIPKIFPGVGTTRNLSLVETTNGLLKVYYSPYTNSTRWKNLYSKTSSDKGETWSYEKVELSLSDQIHKSKVINTDSGELYSVMTMRKEQLYVQSYTPYSNYELYFSKSSDDGNSWSDVEQLTRYIGVDSQFTLTAYGNKAKILFQSDRGGNNSEGMSSFNYPIKFYMGILGENYDLTPPPLIQKTGSEVKFSIFPNPLSTIYHVFDYEPISQFKINYTSEDGKTKEIYFEKQSELHRETGKEYIFKAVLGGMLQPFEVEFQKLNFEYIAVNNKGTSTRVSAKNKVVQYSTFPTKELVNVNKLNIPISNFGNIGEVVGQYPHQYEEGNVLYSAGFALTGLVDQKIVGNGVFGASRIADYIPGSIESRSPKLGGVFIVKSSDPPFGEAWHEWRYAVADGAKFYDGDNDGIYNPIDKNRNGIWDTNEDKPDLIGDFTAWTCYNDGTPSALRKFNDQAPFGIEIKQTVFGWEASPNDLLSELLFVKYSIENKNQQNKAIEDVYFSAWHDPDLGYASDDKTGTDTLSNSTFVYQVTPDSIYKEIVPAYFVTIAQGPVSYIPGVTFVDVNSDGIYEAGIDTPLDTAYQMYGDLLGFNKYPGASNMQLSASNAYFSTHFGWPDVYTAAGLRAQMLGMNPFGDLYDPCSFIMGTISGDVDCSKINPRYIFSGDPVSNVGWLDDYPTDTRGLTTTGPFKLEKNKPIDIIIALIVKRGSSSLNSITLGREAAHGAIEFVKNNFSLGTSGKPITKTGEVISDFGNYPNPFNPVTRINFTLNTSGFVTLNVYDLLGRKVKTLISTTLEAGSHQVDFNASALSSGIYFYEIRTSNFQKINKMMVVR
jgi:hypothetical protein